MVFGFLFGKNKLFRKFHGYKLIHRHRKLKALYYPNIVENHKKSIKFITIANKCKLCNCILSDYLSNNLCVKCIYIMRDDLESNVLLLT